MISNVIKDIVFDLLDKGIDNESEILEIVARNLERRYHGEHLELMLSRMGVETTGKLIDAIAYCKIQYRIAQRSERRKQNALKVS